MCLGGGGELRLKTSRVLSVRSAFFSHINAKIRDSESFAESYINDYRDGSIITLRCYRIVCGFNHWFLNLYFSLFHLKKSFFKNLLHQCTFLLIFYCRRINVCVLHNVFMLTEEGHISWSKNFKWQIHRCLFCYF